MDYCSEVNKNGHIHHLIKKTNLKKKFFLRNFVIGFILTIVVCVLAMMFKDWLIMFAENMYNLTAYDARRLYVAAKLVWMLFLIQFALVPFMSLSLLEWHLKKEL